MKELNNYLANLAVWNVKLHNLHWNVTGPAFVQVHEYLESLYDNVFAQYDSVAELLKMQGEAPMVKMADYLKIATLKEIDGKDFPIPEVLKLVEADMKTMAAMAKDIRAKADQQDNFQVANLMEDYLAGYAKGLWFIAAMQK